MSTATLPERGYGDVQDEVRLLFDDAEADRRESEGEDWDGWDSAMVVSDRLLMLLVLLVLLLSDASEVEESKSRKERRRRLIPLFSLQLA